MRGSHTTTSNSRIYHSRVSKENYYNYLKWKTLCYAWLIQGLWEKSYYGVDALTKSYRRENHYRIIIEDSDNCILFELNEKVKSYGVSSIKKNMCDLNNVIYYIFSDIKYVRNDLPRKKINLIHRTTDPVSVTQS